MNVIEIILPERSDDLVSDGLRRLTARLREIGADPSGGMLGGENGYGCLYENATFLMKPYCWCERDDCRWCNEAACDCAHPMPEYFLDGQPCQDWSAANRGILAPFPHDVAQYGTPEYEAADKAFYVSAAERDRRLVTVWPERIHSCPPSGLMADRPRGDTWKPPQSAPNFWHKPSGARVWWYKYIGRGMEFTDPQGVTWSAVLTDVMASLAGCPS